MDDDESYESSDLSQKGEIVNIQSVSIYGDTKPASNSCCGGTIFGATFNLTNVAVGSGMLSFPYVFYESGLALGIILLVFMGFFMGYIAFLFASICHKIHLEAPDYPLTYESIIDLKFGKKTTLFIIFCVMVNVFAAQLALTIIIGDTLQPVLEQLAPSSQVDSWWLNKSFISLALGVLVVLPLCFFPKIDHLRWTSGVAIFALFFVLFIVFYFAILYWIGDSAIIVTGRGNLNWFIWDLNIFSVIPIISYALSCHIQIPVIYNEIRNPSVQKFNIVIILTFVCSSVLYGGVGLFGYSEFGNSTKGNILQNYPTDNLLVNLARLCMTFMAISSYPLMNFVSRTVLDYLLETTFMLIRKRDNHSLKYSLPKTGVKYYGRIIAVSTVLFFLAWLLSIVVPGIQFVFGLAGATMVTITTFIVPAVLQNMYYPLDFWHGIVTPYAIILVGTIIGVFGTITTITDV